MRTKNAKRLWPVPATLAVMALTALLAFGLMATNGAQPAAAQDKADCTIHLTKASEADATASFAATSDTECDAVGDTAIVEFVGDVEATTDTTVSVLIADKSGSITAYPQGTDWDATDGFQNSSNMTVTSMKYRFQSVTVPKAAQDSQGLVEGQKARITVSGDVRAWIGVVTVHTEIDDIPEDDDAHGARAIEIGGHGLSVTLLGEPVLSEDGADYNKEVDDDIWRQCVVDTTPDAAGDNAELAMSTRLAGEHATNCQDVDAEDWLDSTAVTDKLETRSKLVVRKGLSTAPSGAAQVLIDGKEVTQTVTSADIAVTIYARVQDATGHNLLETGVDFTATTNPTGIVSDRKLSDDPETKSAVLTSPMDDEIMVAGLETSDATDADNIPLTAAINPNDAVASFTLKGLNEIDGAFSITVEVTAGDLDLGTVIITRPDVPETLKAGVFNTECFGEAEGGDAEDFSDDKFNAEAKGCDASGMADRFGAGETFVVKAHLEDSLGNVVGVADDMEAELADEDSNLLGDGDIVVNDVPVAEKTMPRAWFFTVDEDATLGDHMITVSTDRQNADEEDIDSVTLTVSVAGPPTQYMFVDPVDNIELGDRAMFTVQAYDMNDGIPHLITVPGDDKNDTVEIVVPDIAESLVRGRMLDNGVLTLDADTGMGSFTIYAPSNAPAGSTARIFVSAGDVEITHTVTFGDPDATPDPMETDEFTADYTVTATSTAGSGMVDVSWTRSEELSLSLVSLIQGNEVVDFTIVVGTSAQFSEVDLGEYDVSVFSLRNNADGKDGEIAFGTVTVE